MQSARTCLPNLRLHVQRNQETPHFAEALQRTHSWRPSLETKKKTRKKRSNIVCYHCILQIAPIILFKALLCALFLCFQSISFFSASGLLLPLLRLSCLSPFHCPLLVKKKQVSNNKNTFTTRNKKLLGARTLLGPRRSWPYY